jgi:hypothetical protein
MMRFVWMMLTAAVLAGSALAQPTEEWVARYNGPGNTQDQAYAVAADAAGNVYVTGSSQGSSTGDDYATIKYSPNGDQLWVARYNGPGGSGDNARAIAVDAAGNVYVTGDSWGGSGSSYDFATIKYDSDGNQLWVARYNGPSSGADYASMISVDSSGNVYVAGRSWGNNWDYAVVKYSPAGTQLYSYRYNGPGNANDEPTALVVGPGGEVYVTGLSHGGSTLWDYFTLKLSPSGSAEWGARYNGPANASNCYEIASGVALDAAGFVYVTGYSRNANNATDDITTVKYSPSGGQLWVARYTGLGGNNYASGIAVDSGGTITVGGTSAGGSTADDIVVLRYTTAGASSWVRRYNGAANGNDRASHFVVDTSGNTYLTGMTTRPGTGVDFATLKYDGAGDLLWVLHYDGPASGTDYPARLALGPNGTVHVVGESAGVGTGLDYATIKYSQTPPNGPPVAQGDSYQLLEDGSLSVPAPGVLANDTDPENDPLTAILVSGPSQAQSFSLSADGSFDYVPNADFHGTDTFSYKASDGDLESNAATVTITVVSVNDPPVLTVPSGATIDEEVLWTGQASATDPNDNPPDAPFTFSLVSYPAGMTIDPGTGQISWTPTESQGPGSYTVTVRVQDSGGAANGGLDTDEKSFTLTVAEVNRPPVLDPIGSYTIPEEQLFSFAAAASDPDLPANGLTFSLIGAPAGAAIDPATGVFEWTPAEAQGPGVYTFTVRVTDDGSPSLYDEEEITITVDEVLAAPLKGAPADLWGRYLAPSGQIGDPGLASASTGAGLAFGQVLEYSAGQDAAREGTYTPFSDLTKPPVSWSRDLRARAFQFEVDLGEPELWAAGGPAGAATTGETFQVGLGEQPLTGLGLAASFYRNDGGTFTVGLSADQTQAGSVYEAAAGETSFRLTVYVSADGSSAWAKLGILNGPGAGTEVDLGPVSASVSGAGPLFAGFVSREGKSRAEAALSELTTSAGADWLWLFARDPYRPFGTLIEYELGMSGLSQPVGGFQAFLETLSLGGTQIFHSGEYTSAPFPAGRLFGPIDQSLRLAAGVAPGAPMTQESALLALIRFSTGSYQTGSQGRVDLRFKPEWQGLPTAFYDANGVPIEPLVQSSNPVLVDNDGPVLTVTAFQNGHDVTQAPGIRQGLLEIDAQIASDLSGLGDRPTVVIDFSPLGPGPEDVELDTFSGEGGRMRAEYTVPSSAPYGPARIVVTAQDKAGNVAVWTSQDIPVNTATLSLDLQLQGFASGGPSVTRHVQIRLGGSGGSRPAIVLDRDVVFSASGAASLTFDSADGIPGESGLALLVSGMDPLHTLRRTVSVSSSGNQRSASLTLIGGNVNQDNRIDIGDYVVYAVQFGQTVGRNTPGAPAPLTRHADVSGDGVVDNVDFTFIANQFGFLGDSQVGMFFAEDRSIRRTISVRQACLEANSTTPRAMDLNGDGWITIEEIQQYLRRFDSRR